MSLYTAWKKRQRVVMLRRPERDRELAKVQGSEYLIHREGPGHFMHNLGGWAFNRELFEEFADSLGVTHVNFSSDYKNVHGVVRSIADMRKHFRDVPPAMQLKGYEPQVWLPEEYFRDKVSLPKQGQLF